MRQELDEKLVSEFPELYRERGMSPTVTSMCWGFPGDGWYYIIRDLSLRLSEIIDEWWGDLDDERRNELNEFYGGKPCAKQVKEKFGGLRFYMSYYPRDEDTRVEIEMSIAEAERRARRTCEECGDIKAYLRGGGWIKTLCDDCAEDSRSIAWTNYLSDVIIPAIKNDESKEEILEKVEDKYEWYNREMKEM